MFRIIQILTLIFTLIGFGMHMWEIHGLNQINETTRFMTCDAYAYDQESAPDFCTP